MWTIGIRDVDLQDEEGPDTVAKSEDADEVGSGRSSRDLGDGVGDRAVCQSRVTPLFQAPWARQMVHPG